MADDPLVGFSDAMRIEVRAAWWVFVLLGLELLRQIHFLISEHSARLLPVLDRDGVRRHGRRSRTQDVGLDQVPALAAGLIWVLWIVVLAVVDRQVHPHHTDPGAAPRASADLARAAVRAPDPRIYPPLHRAQFVALFWFMSRGGVDVYYPEDIKTRFTDVWGQDHVLARVKENIIFLEHPELVEERGGYVPGGLLLWGPPGTGKTLMAEAVAGETGKPYVFVDPGCLHQHVHGRGHPQGQVALPQATAARAALWRRDRLLRRGRLAGQPRHDDPGRPRRAARRCAPSPTRAATGSPTCRGTRSGGWPGTRWIPRSPTSRTPGAASR